MPKIEFSALAEITARYVNTTNHNIFLTGKAGTGKTTFLKYIVDNTFKNVAVAAPTGIAAINADGVTLHSLLHLPFGPFIPENIYFNDSHTGAQLNTPASVVRNAKFNATKRELLNELELLIIDEVSMLRADLLDCIDAMLRFVRRNRFQPFGGVQILFIGDLHQLPPVVQEREWKYLEKYYSSSYFFDAKVIRDSPPLYVELDKIHRQSDDIFIGILNRLRNNRHSAEDIALLNQHYQHDYTTRLGEGYIHITTHNYKADETNNRELAKITEDQYRYGATIDGDFPENMYPVSPDLNFKLGAQVMFIKNDIENEKRYFNGKIGKITTIKDDFIGVTCEDGYEIEVDRQEWENKRYTLNKETNQIEEKIIGIFRQYPLKLAWAITVHKSQGLTFEKAILDLSGAFAPGQVYVALSRLTSLDGLVLSTKIPDSGLNIEKAVTDFANLKAHQEQLENALSTNRKSFLQDYIGRAFNFGPLITELSYHLKGFDKEETRSAKQQYLQWTREFINDAAKLKEVGDKFIKEVHRILADQDYLPLLKERVTKARGYFENQLKELLTKLDEHEQLVKTRKKVKGYLKELGDLEAHFNRQQQHIIKVDLLLKGAAENRVISKKELGEAMSIRPKKTKEKKEKTPTREISFNMYKQAISVDEIAQQRNLAVSTIQGHLAPYIESGELPVTDFVDQEQIDKIIAAGKKVDNQMGQIKSKLGDSVTYPEIKFVLAHLRQRGNSSDDSKSSNE
ncbi:MAG: helix-turn-helix domain-containing protein [Cyclobacteriaceae bacterium]